jgi:ATP-dependent protease Clp ATPase subunit
MAIIGRFFVKYFGFLPEFVGRIHVWLQCNKVLDISHEGLRHVCENIAVYGTVT